MCLQRTKTKPSRLNSTIKNGGDYFFPFSQKANPAQTAPANLIAEELKNTQNDQTDAQTKSHSLWLFLYLYTQRNIAWIN